MDITTAKLNGNVLDFILAGNATFTVKNNDTNNRYTFRIRQPEEDSPHFVQVLVGPLNTRDYAFLGTIFNKQTYITGS